MIEIKKFSKIKQTAKTSLRLIVLVWSIDKWLFLGNLIAVTIPAIVPYFVAFLFKLLIDQVVLIVSGGTANYSYLTTLLALSFIFYLAQDISFSVQDYINRLIFTKIPISLYQIVLSKISSLDISYFENSEFRTTLEKVKDSYAWRPLEMMQSLLFTFQGIVQALVAVVILATLNPLFIFLVLIVAIPEFINRVYQSQLSWTLWDEHGPNRKRFWYLSNLLQERDSLKELRIFNLPPYFLNELKSIHEKFYLKNKHLATRYFGINTIFNLFGGFIFIGILVFIIFEAVAKRISVGDISYFSQSLSNFQNGIGGLFRNIVRLFENSLYVSSMFEVLDVDSQIKTLKKAVKLNLKKAPTIEFRNVTFSYPDTETKILENFSLTIKGGEKIAFVGENGVGKTTLIKLLARFYDVSKGGIYINGVNLKELDLESWYKSLGILFQDFVRYEYPAKDNIFFGKVWDKENLKQIKESARLSGAKSMIEGFKGGYDQMLGRLFEDGVEPSGGQWQKIALARAYFRNSPVLILDEPTASLDAKAEAEVFNKVEKLSKEKTVIIISHRFSTVRNADKIFVIVQGKITESGTHDDLIKLDGQYAKLFNLQAKGYQ